MVSLSMLFVTCGQLTSNALIEINSNIQIKTHAQSILSWGAYIKMWIVLMRGNYKL